MRLLYHFFRDSWHLLTTRIYLISRGFLTKKNTNNLHSQASYFSFCRNNAAIRRVASKIRVIALITSRTAICNTGHTIRCSNDGFGKLWRRLRDTFTATVREIVLRVADEIFGRLCSDDCCFSDSCLLNVSWRCGNIVFNISECRISSVWSVTSLSRKGWCTRLLMRWRNLLLIVRHNISKSISATIFPS